MERTPKGTRSWHRRHSAVMTKLRAECSAVPNGQDSLHLPAPGPLILLVVYLLPLL